ncbi:MAG: hypothetical protein ACLFPA_11295 [Dichotomicrobium sp.]
MGKLLCIYHGNCADGFGAAWVVRYCFGEDVEFHAGVYQDPPPDVTGRDVLMVDFCYKRPVLDEMANIARSIVILDHHKSAAEDLGDLPESSGDWDTDMEMAKEAVSLGDPPVFALFDMERSGAGITWDYLFPRSSRPPLINHIEDRDLWRFALEGTREIQAAVFSHPYDFRVWDELMQMDTEALRSDGRAIERKHFKDIREFIGAARVRMEIAGYFVPALNAPYCWSSDAGHEMAAGEPFAACYWDTPDGRVFSLRSLPGGVDVSSVARQYGGGGHEHAAGFRVPHGAPDMPELVRDAE